MPDKKIPDDRKLDSFRIMVTSDFKARVQDMCADIGENVSDMTRGFWSDKLTIWEKRNRKP